MNQQGPRMIAGAILVLAGAVLFGAGIIADTWQPLSRPQQEHGNSAVILSLFAGMAIAVSGFLILLWGVAGSRNQPIPENDNHDSHP